MAKSLNVEVVAADRKVWSGEARLIVARTTEGEIGILADHEPVLALLVPGIVTVTATDGQTIRAAVDGGFLSMADNTVAVLAEAAVIADEVDRAAVQRDRDEAEDDETRRWAETRLRLVDAN